METLANNGNGNYFYIDNLLEGKKVFNNELIGTLYTIANDVKIQMEFNPEIVNAYRLIGYENRLLEDEEFLDDARDAGEIGSGHYVTALYEIQLTGKDKSVNYDYLKYPQKSIKEFAKKSNEILNVKIRYKLPGETESKKLESSLYFSKDNEFDTSEDFLFSVAVAEFGMVLRDSEYLESWNFDRILNQSRLSKRNDYYGYRSEFIRMVETAQLIAEYKDAAVLYNPPFPG